MSDDNSLLCLPSSLHHLLFVCYLMEYIEFGICIIPNGGKGVKLNFPKALILPCRSGGRVQDMHRDGITNRVL